MSSSKFTTNPGMPVKQLYKADDIHSDHEENIEEPGVSVHEGDLPRDA
jgi:hypothetical protein